MWAAVRYQFWGAAVTLFLAGFGILSVLASVAALCWCTSGKRDDDAHGRNG